jgi:MarR family transcriptional regulator, organic hydroperoxide resistance regulator
MPKKSDTPFSFKKSEDSPGFLLWQTSVIWQRIIKTSLEEHDISHSQFVIMASLMWFELHHIEITQTTLINWTKLDKMTVSKSLKKLATLGLVTRIEHEVDTRAKSVSLTDQGKDLITKLIPIIEKIDQEFFGNVSHEEQQTFIQILRKLIGELQ